MYIFCGVFAFSSVVLETLPFETSLSKGKLVVLRRVPFVPSIFILITWSERKPQLLEISPEIPLGMLAGFVTCGRWNSWRC